MSPSVGELDEQALRAELAADGASGLALLVDLVAATDERLRAAARRLAARLLLERARRAPSDAAGATRIASQPAHRGGDLDVDRSMDAVVAARSERRRPSVEDLHAETWVRSDVALCLVLDASGSMAGEHLAAAALVTAACALRCPGEIAVLAFAGGPRPLAQIGTPSPPGRLVDEVLALRGSGPTDLARALAAAGAQLARARARRRVVLLLSDCRATAGAVPAVLGSDHELLVLAPAGDSADAADFARRTGARFATLADPLQAPAAVDELLR